MSESRSAPRLGIVASRRVGNAVKRNYGKRMFRELFRKHAAELPRGSELVIVLRNNFDRHSFEDLGARLLRACDTIQKNQVADIATDSWNFFKRFSVFRLRVHHYFRALRPYW